MTGDIRKDLVILVPDKDIEAALHGLLGRPQALSIRPITYRIFVNADRDPGCLVRPEIILNARLADNFQHALVVLDHHGCGRDTSPPHEEMRGSNALSRP